jgi:RimJ/RimL family protein N-acetyltransferase
MVCPPPGADVLSGTTVTLRPVREEDLPTLHAWHVDPHTWVFGNDDPLWPMPFSAFEATYPEMGEKHSAEFAIEVGGTLVGRCGMFRFDEMSRRAMIGVTIGGPHRGKRYGQDALRVLLDYGFRKRNLHRIELETLATNEPALRAYRTCGFVEEGRLREHAYVEGSYVDVVLMAILRTDWEPSP